MYRRLKGLDEVSWSRIVISYWLVYYQIYAVNLCFQYQFSPKLE